MDRNSARQLVAVVGDLNTIFGALTDLLLGAAGQPWIYLVVVLGCIIDGFFPPFPSEAIVVGLASLMLAPGGPEPWLLLPAAALGAFIGDNVAYGIGRRVGTTRFKWMRAPIMVRSFDRVGQKLEQRAVSFILVARFLPVVRVAVNLTAGATGYSRKCFMAITAFSATLWAGYSLGIGVLAGTWFQDSPMLGLVVAIVIAALLGLIADWVAGLFRRKAKLGTPANAVVAAESGQDQLVSR
ncbi:DedA family protein [Arthrobacter glacialis]|uniref:DedA family protein n=1 Tax=Arthrobacter glacialis TaxID=1664 RepID=UPI000CD4801C|nr:DedA family protein [Arthrobacter glacialis]POH58646.1 alkaline phosphatase [Arthrobacter glacialis]